MAWTDGLYLLRGEVGGIPYSLLVRLDVLGTADRAPMGFVSCDLYQGWLSRSFNVDQSVHRRAVLHLGSFRSRKKPRPDLDAAWTVVVKVLPGGGATIRLTLFPAPDVEGNQAEARVRDSGGLRRGNDTSEIAEVPFRLRAVRVSDEFQRLTLVIDKFPRAPDPVKIIAPVTGPMGPRNIRFADAMRIAGLHCDSVAIDGPPLVQTSMQMGELRSAAALRGATKIDPQASLLAVYMMVASSLAGDSSLKTLGIMFDKPGRRSAAVFYDALRSRFSGSELRANYLLTFVHELGHCLNLPHAFEAARLTRFGELEVNKHSASFMNYPDRYHGQGGRLGTTNFEGPRLNQEERKRYKRFWEDFEFNFVERELLELRHGDRRDILTGPDVTPYRGEFGGARVPMAIGGDNGRGLSLELRVRGGARSGELAGVQECPIFEFGEPIHVEARLSSTVRREKEFDTPLSLAGGGLTLDYQKPNGSHARFAPPCRFSQLPEVKILHGRRKRSGNNAFYKDLQLSFGADPFAFVEPGPYRLRAAYRYGDTLLLSNVFSLFVRYPRREIEDLIVPLLDSDVAEYFAYRGVRHLPGVDSRLQAAFGDGRQPPTKESHPLHWYYYAYEARMRAAGMVQFNSKADRIRVARRPKDALHWFRGAFGLRDLSDLSRRTVPLADLPYSNVQLAKLGKMFLATLIEAREDTLAEGLRYKLVTELRKRRVKQSIRDRCLALGRGS